jgi:hypothetical protein
VGEPEEGLVVGNFSGVAGGARGFGELTLKWRGTIAFFDLFIKCFQKQTTGS